jgi:hypothetical protein
VDTDGTRDTALEGATSSGASTVKVVTLSGATHFAHLDRPERGRQTLVDALEAFLLKSPQ